MVYVSFVIDCFARMIVGWQASKSLRTDLCLDALEQAIWSRKDEGVGDLIHHSDRGSQYLSIRYTERLAEAGGVQSVGSKGDSMVKATGFCMGGDVVVRHGFLLSTKSPSPPLSRFTVVSKMLSGFRFLARTRQGE